ncbi:MAG: hypothetical protein H6739_38440 [Alphaproteobacteria bacterium]|nr:hypothetical protein [Alphaproteobacteria bacterium]
MTLPLMLALMGCTGGSVKLGDDTGTSSGDDTGVTTDDTSDTQDTGPQPNAWAGDYQGDVRLLVPEWDWQACEGEVEVTIEDDGALAGAGYCTYESDWGDDVDLGISLEGQISDEGDIEGVATFEWFDRGGTEEIEADLTGGGDDGSIWLDWATDVRMGGGGGGYEVEMVGEADAELR